MTTDDPEASTANCRSLLESMLEGVRRDEPLDEVVGSNLEPRRVVEVLGPPTHADAKIDWLVVNGERVDAVLTAGDQQWRVAFGCSSATTIDWIDVFERPAHFDGIAGGHAIVVNGPSGAGKSIVMQALQQIAPGPLVVFDEPEHIGTVRPEFLIWRDRAPTLHRGYLDAIAALARAGNQVAVSAAGHRQSEFVDAFVDVPVLAVGLTCKLDVLLQRERRTGRWGGIAAGSLDDHDGWAYDLEFDTTDDPDPTEIARQVLTRVERSVALEPRLNADDVFEYLRPERLADQRPGRSRYAPTSCARLLTPSFWNTWARCVLTVARLTINVSATCWFVWPSATSATTRCSDGVSASHPDGGRARLPRRRRARATASSNPRVAPSARHDGSSAPSRLRQHRHEIRDPHRRIRCGRGSRRMRRSAAPHRRAWPACAMMTARFSSTLSCADTRPLA